MSESDEVIIQRLLASPHKEVVMMGHYARQAQELDRRNKTILRLMETILELRRAADNRK